MANKLRWSVRLGQSEWSKFTYLRPADDPLQVLGSARHGHQQGALARLADALVLVVGDHVTPLSKADQKQLAAAMPPSKTPDQLSSPSARAKEAPPPVIIIKRRRIPARPLPPD